MYEILNTQCGPNVDPNHISIHLASNKQRMGILLLPSNYIWQKIEIIVCYKFFQASAQNCDIYNLDMIEISLNIA